jgi:hypothetical protein
VLPLLYVEYSAPHWAALECCVTKYKATPRFTSRRNAVASPFALDP